MNIAICDDDRPLTGNVEKLLHDAASEQGIDVNCEIFFDGSSLIKAVTERQMRFDLVYLDIEMEDMNGIQTALALRETELPILIIYMSGHEEYLKELFTTEPFRFLPKPIEDAAFRSIFFSACERIRKQGGYFTFSYKKVCHRIPYDKITCFESNGRIVTIHTAETGKGNTGPPPDQLYGKINEIEKQIAARNGRFLRIHQSFLVNFDYIKSISATEVRMFDGRRLQISEDRRKEVQARFLSLSSVKGG